MILKHKNKLQSNHTLKDFTHFILTYYVSSETVCYKQTSMHYLSAWECVGFQPLACHYWHSTSSLSLLGPYWVSIPLYAALPPPLLYQPTDENCLRWSRQRLVGASNCPTYLATVRTADEIMTLSVEWWHCLISAAYKLMVHGLVYDCVFNKWDHKMVINWRKGQQQPQSHSILIHCTTLTQKVQTTEATAVIQIWMGLLHMLRKSEHNSVM